MPEEAAARTKGRAETRPLAPMAGKSNSDAARFYERRAAFALAGTHKVNAAVQAPDCCDAQRQQRLHLGSVSHEGPDQIERHAGKVRQQSEDGNDQVANHAELRV